MSLPNLCIRRPVFTTMLILLPVVMGIIGALRMGVDLLPKVDIPIVVITTNRLGASVEEMETGVTKKIEEAVNTISGIDELISNTREGTSQIRVVFDLEKDPIEAQQEVQSKINQIVSQLPAGTDTPIVDKVDLEAIPILTIAVSGSDKRPLREVTEIADRTVQDALASLRGVGSVNLSGGERRAVQVIIDADKLESFNLSIDQIKAALRNQNLELPGGRVDQSSRELTLRTMGRIADTRDFNDLIVATIDGEPIRIQDIGRAEDSIEEPRTRALLDGRPTVQLIVLKQSGENTVDVIQRVKDELATLKTSLALEGRQDIQLTPIRDQSGFIEGSIHEVRTHLILGGILVSLTILLFLRDWRTMIIASLSIPVSIVGTFAVMYWLGFTFNNITMLALVMAVGIVIDDAVVVHENIFRWMEEKGYSAWEAARAATNEIALAVLATTFSLVVIFLPIAFMSGMVGRFFYSFGITMAVAILVSLLVSFTLTPMLCSRFLKLSKKAQEAIARGDHSHHSGGLYGWIAEKPYMASLRWSLRHRWVVMLAALFVVLSLFPWPVGNWIAGKAPENPTPEQKAAAEQRTAQWAFLNYPGLVGFIGFDFLPQDDESQFDIGISLPSGYTLERTTDLLAEIEAKVRAIPGYEIEHVLTTIGDTSGRQSRGTGDVTNAGMYIRIPPLDDRQHNLLEKSLRLVGLGPKDKPTYTQFEVMAAVREVLKQYPDLRTSVGQNGPAGGPSGDLELILTGPSTERLQYYADLLLAEMRQMDGLADVDTTLPNRKPELRIDPNRDRVADLGLQVRDLASALQIMVGGQIVSDYKDNVTGEQYDVWLRGQAKDRSTREAVENLAVMSPRAGLVKVGSVANIEEARGPGQIDRFNLQRKITIVANTARFTKDNQYLFFKWQSTGQLPISEAVGKVNAAFDRLKAEGVISPEYQLTSSGRAKRLQESNQAFLMAFILSLILMYMILAAQFESFIHPITILLAVPITIPFAVLSMIILGQNLNLYAILGVFLLFGIVKKNGILQVDYTNQLRAKGVPLRDAVLEANKTRLRPILMTTVMLVAGMIPLALGQGPGAGNRSSMANVIIGGQSLSLLLTLLVTPVAYTLWVDLAQFASRFRGNPRKAPSPKGPPPLPRRDEPDTRPEEVTAK